MKMKFFSGLLAVLLCSTVAIAEETIRMATTTSTYETGLLDTILPPFEKANKVKVHVISVGTGKAIKLGQNGDVDIILVHARKAEDKFVDEGYGVNRKDVMYNDFIILGSAKDPAGIKGMDDAKKALARIKDSKTTFVSRGDDSGTHKKEKSLWEKANIEPKGDWYLESGQGMSATLRVADEKNACVLIDRGTYLAQKKNTRLKILVEGDVDLSNPYGVIAVNPKKHKHVKAEMAEKLSDWFVSVKCQKLIADFRKNGEALFHPYAVKKKK